MLILDLFFINLLYMLLSFLFFVSYFIFNKLIKNITKYKYNGIRKKFLHSNHKSKYG